MSNKVTQLNTDDNKIGGITENWYKIELLVDEMFLEEVLEQNDVYLSAYYRVQA